MIGVLRGAGLARTAWRGGAGVEVLDVGWGSAAPGVVAGWRCQAEVAAEFGDDVRDGAGQEVGVEVGVVEAVAQLGGEGLGAVAFVGGAVDGVLDGADDLLAGVGAGRGRVEGKFWGLVQALGEGDAAADGPGDAVEGCCEVDQGGRRRLVRRVRGRMRGDGGLGGLGLDEGLAVQGAGEAGAHGNEVVEGLAVPVRACCGLAGVVWVGGLGWVG